MIPLPHSIETAIAGAVLFLVLTFLSACGSEDPAPAPGPTPEAQEVAREPGEAEDTSELERAQDAFLVATEADLPKCSRENEGILVYVRDTQEFRSCGYGSWEVIDVRGERGEDGKDGEPASSTVWLDPLTKLHWMVSLQSTWDAAANVCEAPYHWPTCAELQAGSRHGLHAALPQHVLAWCSNGDSGGMGTAVMMASAGLFNYPKTEPKGIYCVENDIE